MQGNFKIVINYIKRRKIRSYLTIIGIFIGIAAVVALISLGEGMKDAVNYQFSRIGSNRIMISPASGIRIPATSEMTTAKLYERDVDVVKRIDGVEFASGIYISSEVVSFGREKKRVPIFGIEINSETLRYLEKIGLFEIAQGRNQKPGEKNAVVVGYRLAERAFDKEIRVGSTISIGEREFEVVGIQSHIGTGTNDRIIRMPKTTLQELSGKTDEVSMIIVTTKEGADTIKVAEEIKERLRRAHSKKIGQEDFSVQTAKNIIESFTDIMTLLQALLVGIAAISLLVGGIGIMNTMYTSVLERTRDIGIMKAVGAKNSDILWLYLLESGTLGLFGGALGVVIGIALSKTVSFIAATIFGIEILKIKITPVLIIGPLLFSFLVGVFSGVFPAVQASKLKPVDSLRYE